MKVQDSDLAAREAHYHATCRRDYTREAHYHATCQRDYTREVDRHQQTIKDTKTIEEQASNKTIQTLFSVHCSVCYGQNRLEIKRLQRYGKIMKLEHSRHLLCRGKQVIGVNKMCQHTLSLLNSHNATMQRCIDNAHRKSQLSEIMRQVPKPVP